MFEVDEDLANPTMAGLPRRVAVVVAVVVNFVVEEGIPPRLLEPRRYTGGRGEFEIPDLEVHTLQLPDGDDGRIGGGVWEEEEVVAAAAAKAFRKDDDFGGGVWGE